MTAEVIDFAAERAKRAPPATVEPTKPDYRQQYLDIFAIHPPMKLRRKPTRQE
jgi:hypothetical protein